MEDEPVEVTAFGDSRPRYTRPKGGLPTLTIVRADDVEPGRAMTDRDLVILLDGEPIRGLTGLSLSLGGGDVNSVELTILPGDVEVDLEALAAIVAKGDERTEVRDTPGTTAAREWPTS